jgi:hypothetical protein
VAAVRVSPQQDGQKAGVDGGATPQQARAIASDYGDAQLEALRLALGAVSLVALLSLWFTWRLPAESLAEAAVDAEARTPVAA